MDFKDFKDQIKQLSARIEKLKDSIANEEATKMAFVIPFLQALGYDTSDPTEVVPEMDCDITKKKGEKIDYAICKDGEPIMLIECKHCSEELDKHKTQLKRYFGSSNARFGVLTNGIEYRFYTDNDKQNVMDDIPFLVVNMCKLKDEQIITLSQFHKSKFDLDGILRLTPELKYRSELKSIICKEFQNPSDEMVRVLARRVYNNKKMTQKVTEQFKEIVKQSLNDYITDVMTDRLNIVISSTKTKNGDDAPAAEQSMPKSYKQRQSASKRMIQR